MYKEDFENYNNKLQELYNNDPARTTKELRKLVNKLTYPGEEPNEKLFNNSIDKEKFIICIICILIALLGLLNWGNADTIGLYYFGLVFFLAGYFVSTTAKGIGIVFLFSHGMTGLGLMLGSILYNVMKNPLMTDGSKNLLIYLVISLALIIAATIITILRNLSDTYRLKKYTSLIPITLYFIAILMIVIFPKIINFIYSL